MRAQDKATGREQHITITASTNLSEDEVKRLIEEAQRHAEEDRKRQELVDARNEADSMIYQIERTMNELGEKVPGDLRAELESLMNDLRSLKETSNDAQIIRRKMDELRNAAMKIGQQAYGGQPGAGPTTGPTAGPEYGPGPSAGEGPDVVEGEYREVN